MRALILAVAMACAVVAGARPAHAVDSGFSQPGAAGLLSEDDAARFAKQVESDLAAQGARVAIVFRTGRPRDRLPEGISYTHGAFWVYQQITLADGRIVPGYAVYNLYSGSGGTDPLISSLVQDFPLDFTRGSAVDDVAVIVPTPEMQRRILAVMASPTYAGLHVPAYSLISNPFDLRFQNCNEFMLDVVAAAAWETSDPRQIKANLREHFRPSPISAGPLQRIFGPMADPRLRLSDHRGGRIATVTYESLAAFMTGHTLASRSYVLARDPQFQLATAPAG